MRKTDAFLKYMLEFALEDKADEIAKILKDYGVPLVQCSKCIVPGDLPAHGSYTAVAQTDFKARPDLASPDQVVTKEKVENWLAEGADITQELSNAVIANDLDRVKFLVSKGADVNKPDNQGWTPLQSAARQRHDKMIALLIDLGADVNAGDPTPLVAAVMRDHVPSVKVLIEHGADMEKPGQEDFRPLPLAIAEDKYESAKALMEAGADVNSLSGDGRADAADDRGGPDLAGRRRHVRARQHASDRHRAGPARPRRQRECAVEERRDAADDRRHPQQSADDRHADRCRRRRDAQEQARPDGGGCG